VNVYAIAGIAAGVIVIVTLATYFLFFRAGKQNGSATAQLDTTKADLTAIKKADAIVMQEVTHDDLQKSLRDGTF
jgi:hypothetical protein